MSLDEDGGDSIRDTISSAISEVSSPAPGAPPPSVPHAPPAKQEATPEVSATDSVKNTNVAGNTRDANGRFVPKAKQTTTAAPAAGTESSTAAPLPATETKAGSPAVAANPEATQTATKAPQSWRPAAREHWAKLPAEVQAEAVRVDREVRQAMQGAAEARNRDNALQQVLAPHLPMIQAQGGDAMRTIGNLLQTAAALNHSSPADRASIVASIIQDYGVPVEALAAALDRAPRQRQQQGAPEYRDPRVDQLLAQIQQGASQRQAAMAQQTQTEIGAFAETAEFFQDVRPRMGVVLKAAADDGVEMTLQEAYDVACSTHPEVRKTLEKRRAASAANADTASTQRARAAATSVRSQPVTAVTTGDNSGTSLRGDLEGVVAALQNR